MLYEGNRYTEIIEKYTPAAEQGNAVAQYVIAQSYCLLDSRWDSKAGTAWYEKAAAGLKVLAEQGDLRACFLLGECYRYHKGVEMDNLEAMKWYAKAMEGYLPLAEQGDAEAMVMLGLAYFQEKGFKPDRNKTFYYFNKAAQRGHPLGEIWLARCYMFREGVAFDEVKMAYWLGKAAAHGIVEAMDYLGYYHFFGWLDEERDLQDAVIWLERAVELGSDKSDTLKILGICYGWGLGTARNVDKAIEYLEILCTRDYRSARDLLEELGNEGFKEAYAAIDRSWDEF